MVPVAAPPRVRERLHAAPEGPVPVVHRGEQALYVDVGGWCVGVVSSGAARVPCALRLGAGHRVDHSASAVVRGGTLHLDGRPLRIARIDRTAVPRLNRRPGSEVPADPSVVTFLDAVIPERRIHADAVARLVGRGDGLTPLGDDLLAGWLAMHRAAGVATPDVDAAIREHSPRTTLLSATLLDCARHGEVLPEYAAWVRTLGTPDEPRRVRALHRVGATSGAGLHLGGRIALDQIREAA